MLFKFKFKFQIQIDSDIVYFVRNVPKHINLHAIISNYIPEFRSPDSAATLSFSLRYCLRPIVAFILLVICNNVIMLLLIADSMGQAKPHRQRNELQNCD